jgi:AcrR family transcriptional regulator
MRNKIKAWGLEKRAIKLKSEEQTNSDIARMLTKECGRDVSRMSVDRYFKSEKAAIGEAIVKREELRAKEASIHLDVVGQLTHINTETLSILKEAKAARDHKTALLAIQRVEKQLELQARLLGEIDESPKVVSINILRAES